MTQENGLYSEIYGHGPDVVMVHGWGMHTGMWRDLAMQLAEQCRVTCLDLPGHGRSPMTPDFSVAGLGRALLNAAPERAHWIGWSLGATLVIDLAARFSERVRAIVVMAGNPRFTRADDWPTGLDPALLDGMASNLTLDCQTALLRFLALQTVGLPGAKGQFKTLRERLLECTAADLDALRGGLEILQTADVRPAMLQISCPALVLLGAKDTLVPVRSGEAMLALCPAAQLQVIDGAGHMPFVSHPKETVACLRRFLPRES
jgi:pimeloyl-[acyl-carrier protein] methyl ester esterase